MRPSGRNPTTCCSRAETTTWALCLDDAERTIGGPVSYGLYKHLDSLLQLTAEGSFYQDIQYLNVYDANSGSNEQPIQIIIDDEYVDEYREGQTIRINGIVYIDPIPDRNFVKDTRRILQVRAISIEEVS